MMIIIIKIKDKELLRDDYNLWSIGKKFRNIFVRKIKINSNRKLNRNTTNFSTAKDGKGIGA